MRARAPRPPRPPTLPLLLLLGGLGVLGLGCLPTARAQDPVEDPGGAELGLGGAVSAATARMYAEAVRLERAGEHARAERAYELVLRRDPAFVDAIVGLGRTRAARGDTAGALAAWRRAPMEAEAVEEMARLLEESDPLAAAELYQQLQTLRLGDPSPWLWEARARARVEPLEALERYRRWRELSDAEHDGEVVLLIAQQLREAGAEEEAVALLEDLIAEAGELEAAVEAAGRLDRLRVEQAARSLAVGGSTPLSAAQRAEVDRARRRAVQGDVDGAVEDLRGVVLAAPRAAEARGALGEVYLLGGAVDEAEQAWLWATALAPEEPTWHARLGLLLAESYGGRRHAEAAEELGQALALRPAWTELRYHLGVIAQESRDWESARTHLAAYLEGEADGAFAEEARARLEDLERAAPDPPTLPAPAEAPPEVSEEALARYRIARVYLARGEVEAARAELLALRKLAPGWPAALNLEAGLAWRSGDEQTALETWQRSLEAAPDQPLVRLQLGELLLAQGDEEAALIELMAAAEQDLPQAHYTLARLAWEDHELLEAREHLDAYFAVAASGLGTEPARALRARVEQRIRLLQLGLGAGVGVVVLGLGLLALRRRGRRTVAELAHEAPEAVHDLARVLSAVRHEVLKHNTTLLDDVAHALEHGDHHAVSFAAGRLFGEGGGSGGVVARFEEDLDALVRLGRQHGYRVDPRRQDPVLGPMWRAMRSLRRLEPSLRRPERAGRSVPAELRALSRALNEDAYLALGALIRGMGTLALDLDRVRAVDARVRAEPGLAARALPPLETSGPPGSLPVRVFPGDLDDVLANLLRNAYSALPEDRAEAHRVAVELACEDDPITGLEEVLVRVWDTAPGQLTEAMIRGRGIGRGLGLVVDLVTRHDGAIGVVAPPGPPPEPHVWVKAVEVRLPRAEGTEGAELGAGLPARVPVVEEDTDGEGLAPLREPSP